MERGIIAERTLAAHAHKRSKGEATGHAPFGFKLASDGSTLEPDPTELETLAVIDTMLAQGKSNRAIADELNRQQRPAKRGGKWQRSNLRSVLATWEKWRQIAYT
jgi:DNA invertase Pin-like site-specific DNA recombinase